MDGELYQCYSQSGYKIDVPCYRALFLASIYGMFRAIRRRFREFIRIYPREYHIVFDKFNHLMTGIQSSRSHTLNLRYIHRVLSIIQRDLGIIQRTCSIIHTSYHYILPN